MSKERTGKEPLLRVLIVGRSEERVGTLEDGLRDEDHIEVTVLRDMRCLMRRIVELHPDAIVIDLGSPSREMLDEMFQVSRCVRRPLAIFVDHSDAAMIEAAVDAGVAAYVVDGLKKERIKAVLDTTISRFNAFSRLREEVDRAREALEERKLVERAKGVLMKERGLTEEAAYALLRKAAMNENRRIAEVAQSVVTAMRLFK